MVFRNKSGKLSRNMLILIIGIVVVGGITIGAIIWMRSSNDYSKGNIVILKDTDFTKEEYNIVGSGTELDPYRIENRVIDTERIYSIWIAGTTKHFIIKNCTLSAYVAIYINSATTGTSTITNNTILLRSNDNTGIAIDRTPYSIVNNNIIKSANRDNSGFGITIFESSYTTITNNYCENITYGIQCWSQSTNIVISQNTCIECIIGIMVDSENWQMYPDPFQIVYMTNQAVTNNTCLFNEIGIYFYKDISLSDITYNNCSFNSKAGINLYSCESLEVSNNFLGNNTEGLRLRLIDDSLIYYNQINKNTFYGINLTESEGNLIFQNNFINNNYAGILIDESQAFDSTISYNSWYSTSSDEGNYWSEVIWISGVTYSIDGGTNIDPYPLEFPIIL
ncbi:MAG: right-handed parallel beta-helix repeat-containing protein [Candidatus Heimdallarchaeota archaeon]|nr:right-handed parallel beta-helix repeat-containing protein [Candidatus Heimdallarchaeota archaeon]